MRWSELALLLLLGSATVVGGPVPESGGRVTEPVGQAPEPGRQAPELAWKPERPRQGQLFLVRVGGLEERAEVGGEVAGEPLHFVSLSDGSRVSLAPVPVDVEGSLRLEVSVERPDGRRESLGASVPVAPGGFVHERLTVAPRFGSPPDSADRARLARDRELARQVSLQARRTPPLWSDTVIVPRDDRVTSGFGSGRVFNGQVSSRHMGLDLDGETGDPVVAATRGVVALVDSFLLAGNVVYLNHGGGLVSGYFHLSEALVSQGDTVEAGTPVGR
ncbi:MAG TPA: M23 family metallopeptidase, partial [Longimicrobiales bacterium]|nr:M23 family metallopeptidase [Longimicrobiales bacterium]